MSFGDGGPDAVASFGGATFVHTYHDVGTFTGTLTVTSPFGEVSTATASAVVIDLNGTWSTDDLQISCPTPSSGVRSLALTQSGTSLGGSYSGPSGLRPIAGALTGRFVTLTSDDGITFTSDTPNSGVSPDGKSIGLFSNEPCLKGAPMLVFKRQ
jgi:PKD repeat protein